VRFVDLLEEAVNSLPDNCKDSTILTQLPAKVVKTLVEAMAYGPATVAASGELLYSVMPPTVPVDQYIAADFTHDNNMVFIVCELRPGPSP
jgi:hypothetical protein